MRMIEDVVERSVAEAVGEAKYAEEWNFRHLRDELCSVIPLTDLDVDQKELDSLTQQAYTERLTEKAKELYEAKEQEVQPDRMREVERMILLRVVDNRWMDHIDIMDQMRQGIGLQAYAQKNPLDEYKFVAYDMFEELSQHIQEDTLRFLYRIRIQENQEVERKEVAQNVSTNRGEDTSKAKKPVKRAEPKVGRNDPCPCGSGKKYKNCCGRDA